MAKRWADEGRRADVVRLDRRTVEVSEVSLGVTTDARLVLSHGFAPAPVSPACRTGAGPRPRLPGPAGAAPVGPRPDRLPRPHARRRAPGVYPRRGDLPDARWA